MPQPAELDELQDPLLAAYRRAWSRVQAEQQQLLNNPLAYRRKTRLTEVQRSISAMMDGLDDSAEEWVAKQLPKAYAAGIATTTPSTADATWTMIQQNAVQELATNLFQDLLTATDGVRKSTKELVRAVARDEALQKAIEGRTAQQAGREMERVLNAKQIYALRYADGSKHGLEEYTQMAMRTTTAKAYNAGSLSGSPDVAFWEIFDGPQCGLSFHDDPTLALGLIVDRDTAEKYLISHPNCRRAFGPRPDITDAAQAAATKGQVTPGQVAAQRAQDADRLARQQRVANRRARLERRTHLPAPAGETAKAAGRRARKELRDLKTGNLSLGPEPSPPMQDLMPPLEAAAKSVADVPTVTQLIDKGYTAEAAVAEHARLLKNAKNVERRAKAKATGSSTKTVNTGELTAADNVSIGLKTANYKKSLKLQGFDDTQVEELATIFRQDLVDAKLAARPVDDPRIKLINEDMATSPYDEPVVLHSGPDGPGSGRFNPAWYDRMRVDHADYIPVANLQVEGYIIRNGIATRRNGISYMLETGDGVITQAMRDELETHIAKIQATLADVPESARKYQRGYAVLKGNNPADSYWAVQYKMPGFKSAATGGGGGTTFWNSPVNPGTIVHELGHNVDSQIMGAVHNSGGWVTDGPEWKAAMAADQETSKLGPQKPWELFKETRAGSHPITPGKDGVTSYGQASIREDFAEAFRLYTKDRREGKIGYLAGVTDTETGQFVNIRFADMYPERAKMFDKLLGTQTNLDTSWRRHQTRKLREAFGPESANVEAVLSHPGFAKNAARSFGLTEQHVQDEVVKILKEAEELKAAKAAAAEAARLAAEAAKPLTVKDLSFGDKTGIGVKAGNAKKAALKSGMSEAEAQQVFLRTKSELTQRRLDELNAKRGLGSGQAIVDHSLEMIPDFREAERDQAFKLIDGAGTSKHPLAERQGSLAMQAKANIAAELGSRLNTEQGWEALRSYRPNYGYKPFAQTTAAERQKILDGEVSSLISNWAATSGDSDAIAVALQHAIKDEFGTTGNPYGGHRGGGTIRSAEEAYERGAQWMRSFVRVMYQHTQEELKKAGLTHVSVYRGMNLSAGTPWGKVGTHQRPKLMPANSWSANRGTSMQFGSTMFKARIPIERVLGTARTGFGCRGEFEYVIFDSEGLAIVERS